MTTQKNKGKNFPLFCHVVTIIIDSKMMLMINYLLLLVVLCMLNAEEAIVVEFIRRMEASSWQAKRGIMVLENRHEVSSLRMGSSRRLCKDVMVMS